MDCSNVCIQIRQPLRFEPTFTAGMGNVPMNTLWVELKSLPCLSCITTKSTIKRLLIRMSCLQMMFKIAFNVCIVLAQITLVFFLNITFFNANPELTLFLSFDLFLWIWIDFIWIRFFLNFYFWFNENLLSLFLDYIMSRCCVIESRNINPIKIIISFMFFTLYIEWKEVLSIDDFIFQ